MLTQSERQTLLQTARELNQYAPEKPSQTHDVGPCGPPLLVGNQDRPGDDFNARGDVAALLKKRGWQSCGIRPDGNEHWTRPGKPRGSTSATLKDGQFYVFSSNAAPFEQDKAYCPFAVYAMLEHKGDFAKATQTLSTEGFGGREPLGCDVDLSNLIGTVAED